MARLLFSLYVCLRAVLQERRDLALENLALRQQLVVLKRSQKRQHPEQSNLQNLAAWSRYRKWADCIIAMSEELPEGTHPSRPLSTLQLKSMRCCASLIATIVSSCLRRQPMAACDEDQEDALVN
jgi:hypothetical protein